MFFGLEHLLLGARLQLALYLPHQSYSTQMSLDKEYATKKRASQVANSARMQLAYGDQMKAVMDNYQQTEEESEIVDVNKDILTYADVKYSLNLGMAVIRSHNTVDGSVSQSLDVENIPFPHTPGEKSYDPRMSGVGFAPKHRSYKFDAQKKEDPPVASATKFVPLRGNEAREQQGKASQKQSEQ